MVKKIIFIFILGLVFFSFGYYSADLINQSNSNIFKSKEELLNQDQDVLSASYKLGMEESKKKAATSSHVSVLSDSEAKKVFGKVLSVKQGVFTIASNLNSARYATNTQEIAILTNNHTKIFKMEMKSMDVIIKEADEYNQRIQEPSSNFPSASPQDRSNIQPMAAPPQPYNKQTVNITDIRAGDIISVTTEIAVKDSKSVTASEITILPALLYPPKK